MNLSLLIKRICTLFILFMLPTLVWAGSSSTGSIGDVAETLMGPTEIMTKLILVACYIIGIALLLVAMAQYKIHLQSPKLVPLTTPIALVILGVVALLIPYVTNKFETGNAEKQSTKEAAPNLLPTPDISGNKGPALPPPPSSNQPSNDQYNTAPANPNPSPSPAPNPGGGSWTDEPKYNQ